MITDPGHMCSANKKKIRVLQLGSSNGLFGAERWILALVNHLEKEVVESLVASIRDASDSEIPLCIEAERRKMKSYVIDSSGLLGVSAVKQLRKIIVEADVDILHTHGYKTDIIGLLAISGTHCKIITTPHGWTKNPDFKLFVYEVVDRLVFYFFDRVVILSDTMKRSLEKMPLLSKKLDVINNGVDIEELDQDNVLSDELLTWKGNCFLIGYIGRLVEGKGLATLLKAVASHATADWKVAVVGVGDKRDELIALAADLEIGDRVRFFGYREDRVSLLRLFDVFVLPSRSEGTPRCVMESMAAMVPVIASDIPGCRKLISDKVTGSLAQVDNHKDLADKIVELQSDPELVNRYKRNGRAFIEEHYSAVKMAENYTKLYKKIV
ncbi:MAG: glycosyltransferase [Candidatus Thiodiazotropha sp. (ex Dulcina madagascariensis)]|nr:glycosyltransferase [Candidatus Thiodiazotropha sp. (ex Dulcina madagascariensis)]MCU7926462.1 glycosyltransferase [Candidatus Thiodiazotropha sp. (ex Dulcina madagascariensis)]